MGALTSKMGNSNDTPWDIVKSKEGSKALHKMKKVFKRAGFPDTGTLDLNLWERFIQNNKGWILKHQCNDQIKMWMTIGKELEDETRKRADEVNSDSPPPYVQPQNQDVPTAPLPTDQVPIIRAAGYPTAEDLQLALQAQQPATSPVILQRYGTDWSVKKSKHNPFTGEDFPQRLCDYCGKCVPEGYEKCPFCDNWVPEDTPPCPASETPAKPRFNREPTALRRLHPHMQSPPRHEQEGVTTRLRRTVNRFLSPGGAVCSPQRTNIFYEQEEDSQIYPVRVQYAPNPNFNPANAEGPQNQRLLLSHETYSPWYQSDMNSIMQQAPDPRKSPTAFSHYMQRIHTIWTPCWIDFQQLCTPLMGKGAIQELLNYENQTAEGDRVAIVHVAQENRQTAASGLQFLARIQHWCQQQRALAPAAPDIIQKKTDTVRQYYDNLAQRHEDDGFVLQNPDHQRMFKTKFMNGLQQELRNLLLAVRPEAMTMNMNAILQVLEGIEERENEKKRKIQEKNTGTKVTVHVVQEKGQWKTKTNNTVKENRPQNVADMKGKCFFCRQAGHMKKDCQGYKKWLENKEKKQA